MTADFKSIESHKFKKKKSVIRHKNIPIIPRSDKPEPIKIFRRKRPEKVEPKPEPELVIDSDELLKKRMMDSREKDKEEIYELREEVFDQQEEEPKKEKNVFRTANDRIGQGKSDHVIEFGELQKLKSERDLEEAKKKFVSLKEPLPQADKSYKVIQNKNSNRESNSQLDSQFCHGRR